VLGELGLHRPKLPSNHLIANYVLLRISQPARRKCRYHVIGLLGPIRNAACFIS
jgi:hypothetical protein